MQPKELCTDAAALAADGTQPEVGGAVDAQVSGKVTRIEGERVYFSVETVNGAPVHDDEGEAVAKEPDSDDEMRDQAQAFDDTEARL